MISDSFLYILVRIGNGVFAVAILAVFTRLLTPHDYGQYALAIAITTASSGVLFQWLNSAIGRFYPMYLNDPTEVMIVANRGFWLCTVTAFLLFLVALCFYKLLGVEPVLLLILFLITVALGRHNFELEVATAQSSPLRYGILSWAKSAGALITGFMLIQFGTGELGALLGFLIGLVFALFAAHQKPHIQARLDHVDKNLTVNLFRYGLPLSINFFAILIVDLGDRFMIASLLGPAQVAPYAVGYDLVQLTMGPIMNVFFLVAFPRIVRAFESKQEKPSRIFLYILGSRLIAVGLPAAVGVGLLATEICDFVFGYEYRKIAATIMPWLAAAIFVGAFKISFLDIPFLLRNATKYQGYIAIFMAAINIYLNFLLLPHYGVIGAAWATLSAFLVGGILSWLFGRSLLSLPNLSSVFFGSAAASATMAAVLYFLPLSTSIFWLLAKGVLGALIYAATSLILNVADCRKLMKVWPKYL